MCLKIAVFNDHSYFENNFYTKAGIDFMSSWRDRNERDAKPRTTDVYQKQDVEKNKETEIKISAILSKNISFILALLSMLFALISSAMFGLSHNISTNTEASINNTAPNKYVCEENNKEGLETSLIRSNGDKHIFLKWNSNSGYSTANRCSAVTAQLNKYIISENAKYIAYTNTENSLKLCGFKSLEDNCNKENIIIRVTASNSPDREYIASKLIYSINLDSCRVYPNLKIKESKDKPICFIPLKNIE